MVEAVLPRQLTVRTVFGAMLACILLAGGADALAATVTRGGEQEGVRIRERWRIHQNKFDDGATDLHFKLWQKEDNIDLNGWEVEIADFTNSSSSRGNQPAPFDDRLDNHPDQSPVDNPDNGRHAADVNADGATIPHCTWVTVEASFWLTSENTKRVADVNWTQGQGEGQEQRNAATNHGWTIQDPRRYAGDADQWCHFFEIANDELLGGDDLDISNLRFWAKSEAVVDLEDILDSTHNVVGSYFVDSGDHLILEPEQKWTICILTDEPLWGGYIYGAYDIHGSPEVVGEDLFEHPVPVPVAPAALLGLPVVAAIVGGRFWQKDRRLSLPA